MNEFIIPEFTESELEDPGVSLIGKTQFRDVIVNVYHDPTRKHMPGEAIVIWKARNPDSFYTGPMYMGPDGKMSYPEGAVIPVQTARDREQLPSAIILGVPEMETELMNKLAVHNDKEYHIRNNIEYDNGVG